MRGHAATALEDERYKKYHSPGNLGTPAPVSVIRITQAATILSHWIEAVPNDRLAHLVRDATRAFSRALQVRLNAHNVSFGHWTFLRVLWEHDGLTQRQVGSRMRVAEETVRAHLKSIRGKYVDAERGVTNAASLVREAGRDGWI